MTNIVKRNVQAIKNLLPWMAQPTIKIVSHAGAPYVTDMTTIKLASSVKPDWLLRQKDNAKREKFVNCPGMDDMLQAGYLLCAWTDIHIKANLSGISVKLLNDCNLKPEYMSHIPVQGIAKIASNVKLQVMKLPTPWCVFTKAGYSAQVLPAAFHSPFLDDIYVYPGIVDYDKFSSINFIFSALRECELTIPAGTPLLQIIPFHRETITAEVGRATLLEYDKHVYGFPTRVRAAYRKFYHQRKKFTLKART